MRCEDVFGTLFEYLDGALDEETAASVRHHIEGCPTCRLIVDSTLKTIRVYATDPARDMPPELHEQIVGLLREHWNAKFSGSTKPRTCDGPE